MKNRLLGIGALFSVLLLALTALLFISVRQESEKDTQTRYLVGVNEIEQLGRAGQYEIMSEKAEELKAELRIAQSGADEKWSLFLASGVCLFFMAVLLAYVYFAILRPFEKLKGFAGKIAEGNFDVPLQVERSNYFGAFTWAFDSMRREITKARACEREAVENNKTVIATLSHDIKTPIASIRAYCEGLEACMDGTPEKRRKYLEVLIRKCDEVSRLTNDLFLHSLSDLDKLKVSREIFELCAFMEEAVMEIGAQRGDVRIQKPDFLAEVSADKNRLMQITENLINNARKYAKTEIDIFLVLSGDLVEIHFRDYGFGIPDKDMPFIFDKFYRGANCGSEQGSGLGLYIVKYIAEQMDGTVTLRNRRDGLEAVVALPVYGD